ncbi:MAG: hypothetical protein OEV42_14735 [Deltaproteobacteria bacterium]|nr:hypothetical protein [Deltaproteobacteria bacterium]
MSINGNLYDWESVEIVLPSGVAIGVEEISYTDEQGIEGRYGKGSTARGYGRKNYKASGSMTLDKDEAARLRLLLGGSVYKAVPFPIIVSYSNDDQPTMADVLPDVKITKSDTGAKQDEANVGKEKFDFEILSPIKWNGIDAV